MGEPLTAHDAFWKPPSNRFTLFEKSNARPSYTGKNERQLTKQNLKVLDVLRKRAAILVLLDDQARPPPPTPLLKK